MSQIEKVNELLHQSLAEAVNKEVFVPNALITISNVECSKNFSVAKINVSILPENLAGTCLEKLRKSSGQIASTLARKIKIRKIPKFIWSFDPTEKQASEIDKIFLQIEKEREENQ